MHLQNRMLLAKNNIRGVSTVWLGIQGVEQTAPMSVYNYSVRLFNTGIRPSRLVTKVHTAPLSNSILNIASATVRQVLGHQCLNSCQIGINTPHKSVSQSIQETTSSVKRRFCNSACAPGDPFCRRPECSAAKAISSPPQLALQYWLLALLLH